MTSALQTGGGLKRKKILLVEHEEWHGVDLA